MGIIFEYLWFWHWRAPMQKGNVYALIPILVFLVLYLGLGILFEYGLGISMGFYNIPIVVIFLIALTVACFQNRKVSFDSKLRIMGTGIGDKTIVTMVLIFMAAGAFVGTVGRNSAESVAYLMLDIFPVEWSVAILFVVSCFVSLSMGTSVGTITLITPIAVTVSAASGFDLALCVATVIGGAMFGDNLSFISDTTIAACQGQDCRMRDKFIENFKIVIPAAVITLIIIFVITVNTPTQEIGEHSYSLIELIPYIIVLIGGIAGVNVFIVLLLGIVSGAVIVIATGAVMPTDLLTNMGTGVSDMFETTMVAVLVSAICALIRENNGFVSLLNGVRKVFRGKRGGQLGIGILVALMDVATANNTVAIVMANPIAKDISRIYNISRKKTASLLDTFSCISQGIIPYGAQMLVALAACTSLGYEINAFQVMPFMFYQGLLLLTSLVFILIIKDNRPYEDDRIDNPYEEEILDKAIEHDAEAM
ncbi:MAG: Na+/H+ antiporter NhaC family protein [Eggerthellaceae bacterium]|nr:Na+/H+ antiporter NhaC family protein [Eggerthellaceae bacterium]